MIKPASALLLLFICFCHLSPGYGQEQVQINRMPLSLSSVPVTVELATPVSSLAFRFSQTEASFRVEAGTATYQAGVDPHYEGPGSSSHLIILHEPTNRLRISSDHEATVELVTLWVPPLRQAVPGPATRSQNAAECSEPAIIAQADWRAGLTPPSYSRSFTETRHLIVHHSASSNSLTDYTNVVRNIYSFHTEVNGWSDIGYNYLIAPDGSIYAGRDPDGQGAQDLVRGAHFCGSNTNTMGVCVLGNYEEIAPAEAALQSLQQLLGWKSFKDQLNPLAIADHPLNANLPVIAGHRQGCATLCPGGFLFDELEAIRLGVDSQLSRCNTAPDYSFRVFPNPVQDLVQIVIPEIEDFNYIALYDLSGRYVPFASLRRDRHEVSARTTGIPNGLYILTINSPTTREQFRLVIDN